MGLMQRLARFDPRRRARREFEKLQSRAAVLAADICASGMARSRSAMPARASAMRRWTNATSACVSATRRSAKTSCWPIEWLASWLIAATSTATSRCSASSIHCIGAARRRRSCGASSARRSAAPQMGVAIRPDEADRVADCALRRLPDRWSPGVWTAGCPDGLDRTSWSTWPLPKGPARAPAGPIRECCAYGRAQCLSRSA